MSQLKEVDQLVKSGNGDERVTIETTLFSEQVLSDAMKLHKGINQYNADLYKTGLRKQQRGETVSAKQALGILLTHDKIQKVLSNLNEVAPACDASNEEQIQHCLQAINTHVALLNKMLTEDKQ